MNTKIDSAIRQAVAKCRAMGVKLKAGPWCELEGNRVISCDPIFAVLLTEGLVGFEKMEEMDLSHPGFIKKSCIRLNVDPGWLHRFWLGWDRNHHVTIVSKEKDKESESKDEVSGWAIQLRKEFLEI